MKGQRSEMLSNLSKDTQLVGGGPETLPQAVSQIPGPFPEAVILASELKCLLNVAQPTLPQDLEEGETMTW